VCKHPTNGYAMTFIDVAIQTTPSLVRRGLQALHQRRRSQPGAAGLEYYTVARVLS
jgi:hypothetical protein